MNKTIGLNTNLIPFFTGTYESFWDVVDHGDHEELCTQFNFNELMESIQSEYQDHDDFIINEFNEQLTNQGHDGFIKSIRFTGHYSPREYNFATDTLEFDLTIDWTGFMDAIKKLSSDDEFHKFLHDEYTSRDGFLSFTPNNYDELLDTINNESDGYSQSVGATIRYLIRDLTLLGNTDYYNSLEGRINDDWRSNGYNGLSYELVCGDCWEVTEYDELNANNGYCNKCKHG